MKKLTLFRFVFSVGILFALGVNAQNGPLAPVKQVNLSSADIAYMKGDYMAINSGSWDGASIWTVWDGTKWNPTTVTPDQAIYIGSIGDFNRVYIASNITLTLKRSIACVKLFAFRTPNGAAPTIIFDGQGVSMKILGPNNHLQDPDFPFAKSINGAQGFSWSSN